MPGAWQEIKELHKKSTAGAKEGIAFRYFSRPIASFILFHIQHGKITPNQVTIASLIVGIVGSLVHLFWLEWAGLVLGGALFMIAHMLDALDGQLARHRKAGSVVGMHFDFFIDGLKAYLMYGALAARLFFQTLNQDLGHAPFGGEMGSPLVALTPILDRFGAPSLLLIALLGMLALATGVACTDFLKKKDWKDAFVAPKDSGVPAAPPPLWLRAVEGLGHFIVDYPSYILVLCAVNRVDLYFLAYTLVILAYAARTLLSITIKLWRVNPYAPKP